MVDDTANANSWVHPVVDYNYILNSPVIGGELSFNANAVSLTRDDALWSKHLVGKKLALAQVRVTADIGWRRELDRSQSDRCSHHLPRHVAIFIKYTDTNDDNTEMNGNQRDLSSQDWNTGIRSFPTGDLH